MNNNSNNRTNNDDNDDTLCPICYDNNAEYFTECKHKYCIDCLKRLKKCALCNKILNRSLLCQEIQSKQTHFTLDDYLLRQYLARWFD